MSAINHKRLWYKSHNYIWIENLRDQDGEIITSATIDGVFKCPNKKEIESVSFNHVNNGNYYTQLSSNSKTVNLEKGSSVYMDVTVSHAGGSHYIQLIFTIEVDRGT